MADGRIIIDTEIDSSGAEGGVSKLSSKLGSIASTGLKAFIGTVAATGTALAGLGAKATMLASDLSEVQNVVDVTFGDGASQINEWSKNAATSFGIGELQAKKFNGTMGAMLKSMGLSSDEVLNMSENMSGLAGDFASFYNLDPQEAFDKIRSGIAGETEPLKQLGINMSVANLEAYALTQGINKQYKEMTQAEQATLRYNYLMSVSKDAQGDFARTSTSLANQLRIAKLSLQDLGATIGQTLIPLAQEAVKELNGFTKELKDAFASGGFEGLAGKLGDVLSKIITDISSKLPKFVELAVKIIQSLMNGLEKNLPQITKSAIKIIETLILGLVKMLPQLVRMGIELIINLILGIADMLPKLIPEMVKAVIMIVNALIDNIDKIIDAGIALILGLIDGIVKAMPILIEKMPEIIIKIVKALIENSPKLIEASIEIIKALAEGLISCIKTLLDTCENIVGQMKDKFKNTDWKQLGIDIISRLHEGLKIEAEFVKKWFSEIVPQTWADIYQYFVNGLTSVVTYLQANIPILISQIGQWFSELPNKIGFALAEVVGTIVKWGTEVFSYLITNVPIWIGNVVSFFSELPSRIWNELLAVVDRVREWGTNMTNEASGGSGSVVDAVVNIIGSLPGKMLDIGKNIVHGIWNGIIDAKDWLMDKVSGFCNSVVAGFMKGFDEHSPSRIMRDLVGVNLVKGIGVGINLETPNLESDIDKHTSNIVARMKGVVDLETAKTTASVASARAGITSNSVTVNNKIGGTIEVPVVMEGKEVMRVTAPYQYIYSDYNVGR